MSGIGATPLFEAPTIARLSDQLIQRPLWAVRDPLPVDPETYRLGYQEMTEIQKRRGFPVAAAVMDRPNFLLMGVPVVQE
jgi:hypothetical protein